MFFDSKVHAFKQCKKDKWQTGEIFATYIIVKQLLSRIYWKHLNWEEKTTTIKKNEQKICIESSQKKKCKWSLNLWKDIQHSSFM